MQTITISENLDNLTIVHEASHAWFNSSLFTNRWITEGLANEYAARTLAGLSTAVSGPPVVKTTSAAAFALNDWGPPAPIRTKAADARETWGYDASWTVVREVVAEVGEPGMRRVFAAAAAGTTAYPGAGTPEATRLPNDWRRFVDLAEELGGGTGVAEMIAPWALTPADRAQLAARRAARSAYHDLGGSDGDWAAPPVVRMALDGWDFAGGLDDHSAGRGRDREPRRDPRRGGGGAPGRSRVARGRVRVRRNTRGPDRRRGPGGRHALIARRGRSRRRCGGRPAGLDHVARACRAGSRRRPGRRPHRLAAGRYGVRPQPGPLALGTAITVAGDAGRIRLVALGAALAALLLLLAAAAAMVRRRSRGGADARAAATPVGPGAAGGPADPAQATPAGWQDQVAPDGSAAAGPYPILPPNATAGTPPEPPAGTTDEGAEPT